MKHIWIVLLSVTILFSASVSDSIVGSWKLDKTRTIKANKKVDTVDMKMFEYLNIYINHSVEIKPAGLQSKWVKNGEWYSMIVLGDKVPITLLDTNHLKLKFEDTVYYKRISNTLKKLDILKQAQVKFKLGKIYRSKIKDDYAFILLSKKRTMYFLQTDRKKKISIKEIKAGKIKKQKKRSGFYFSDNTIYELKNGNPYMFMEDKEIKVISSQKFKYRGNIYELQK